MLIKSVLFVDFQVVDSTNNMNNSNSSNNNKDVGYSDGICNGRGPLYHPPAGQKYQLLLFFFQNPLHFKMCVIIYGQIILGLAG